MNKTRGMTLGRDKETPAKFLPCLLQSTNMNVVAIELLRDPVPFQRLIKMGPFNYKWKSQSL